jgi:hypothetical protein
MKLVSGIAYILWMSALVEGSWVLICMSAFVPVEIFEDPSSQMCNGGWKANFLQVIVDILLWWLPELQECNFFKVSWNRTFFFAVLWFELGFMLC